MFRHLISFLLLRTHGSALSLYVRNLPLTQVSSRPGLYNGVGFQFIACPRTFGLFQSYSRGAVGILEVTAQRRHFKFAVICNQDADCTYLQDDETSSHCIGYALGSHALSTPILAS